MFINRLDIRTKLLSFICIVILCFALNKPIYILVLLGLLVMTALINQVSLRQILSMVGPLVPILALILVFNLGHLEKGLLMVTRIFVMVVGSSLFVAAASVDELLQLMDKLKVPYEYAFAITTAFRFIPTMNQKRLHIVEAQTARGAKLDEKNLSSLVNNYVPVMVPMMVNSIRMSNNLAMAMLNRGYGYTTKRTVVRQSVLKIQDYLVGVLVVGFTVYVLYIQ